jgi:succinyl-diaminopimelate desuccinylase
MLSGHFDVVEPSPDDTQLNPVIDGDYLWGRGAGDMKTVVATYLTWMRDTIRRRPDAFPPINLLLVGNEENGEAEPYGTPHVLAELEQQHGHRPSLLIAGERTGEKGDERFGDICVENRGVMRLALIARGVQEHTGVGANVVDLGDRIILARNRVGTLLQRHLTQSAEDGWNSDYRFSFISVGTAGVYNITADEGHLGLEIRPIPQDNVDVFWEELETFAKAHDFEIRIQTAQAGVACDRSNPYLTTLVQAVRDVSGVDPVLGRKKAGTSARFAPRGHAVIWGQAGIGPHTPNERHYIPSIIGYYNALDRYAELLTSAQRSPDADA